MAKFLNTSGLNYYLEELIKRAKERLILISPYLQFNDRIKELIQEKNAAFIPVRIIYGKTQLDATEAAWLRGLKSVKIGFCKNLHAKCYLNENAALIASLNLYEFSQVNNNEMGVLLSLRDDEDAFREAVKEAERLDRLAQDEEQKTAQMEIDEAEDVTYYKLTSSKLAQQRGMKTPELLESMLCAGLLEDRAGKHYLTEAGKAAGGEFKKGRAGYYFIWPPEIQIKQNFLLTLKRKLF
jgi:hypothetical protein